MALKTGEAIHGDGPLAAPVREAGPVAPKCPGCGADAHRGRRCEPTDWRARALAAEARVAEMLPDYKRGVAVREAYEAWAAMDPRKVAAR